MSELVQALAHGESGVDERQRVAGRQCVREHCDVALVVEDAKGPVDEVGIGRSLRSDRQEGGAVVAPPRAEPRPTAPPSQQVMLVPIASFGADHHRRQYRSGPAQQ